MKPTLSQLTRDIYAIEARLNAGEKGKAALKAAHRKLYAEYVARLSQGEAA